MVLRALRVVLVRTLAGHTTEAFRRCGCSSEPSPGIDQVTLKASARCSVRCGVWGAGRWVLALVIRSRPTRVILRHAWHLSGLECFGGQGWGHCQGNTV